MDEVRTWMGTRFVHQGYSKQYGCDCIGLIHGVGLVTQALHPEERPEELRKYAAYSRVPEPALMRSMLKTFFIPIPLQDAIEADILWFRIGHYPRHLGIITEPGIVIHSDTVVGRVIEHGIETSRLKCRIAAFSFPDISEE